MGQVATIPRQNIEQIQLYINEGKKTLAQIKAETGADYIMNGGLFDMAKFKANCHLKADGYVYAEDPYTYWGFGWSSAEDLSMQIVPNSCQNYICCVELIRDGKPKRNLIYSPAQGGKRGRTAIGLHGDKLCLYVSSDSSDAKTPEQLRDYLASLGWDSAVMLDCGGSSQCDFNGKAIRSSRIVHNLILFYLKKGEKKPVSKKYTVCLDPGHGPGCVNGSPDGTYKEFEFAWDMYTRIRPMLEQQGINVVGTKDESGYPSLWNRCRTSNNAKADLFVSLHTNAVGCKGWSKVNGLIVITSMGPETAQRNVAAKTMLQRFQEADVAIRGNGLVHNKRLVVLAKTKAPACLIEYGFHTNREDVALLKDYAHRDKLALATAKGICDFLEVEWQESDGMRSAVQKRFGFEDHTMDYLERYRYANALLRKLATLG
jgi:N-acetylmuramoyl-L-alanine amidase